MNATEVRIALPVRDEEERLGRCLAGLHAAIAAVSSVARVRVVVVLDACRDGSGDIVERWRRRGVPGSELALVEISEANVGAARRAAMDMALDGQPSSGRQRLWLATTDADSVVPGHWLVRQLQAHAGGARAWAGTVRLDTRTLTPPQRLAWTHYQDCPGPSHRHVHGANMACDAEIYREAGGFSPLPSGEDRALHAAIRELGLGAPMCQDRGAPVTTSTRTSGRAPDGFAADLLASSLPAEPAGLDAAEHGTG